MADCAPIDALAGIEARQNELLTKLDDLNREIEQALIRHGAEPVGTPVLPNTSRTVPLPQIAAVASQAVADGEPRAATVAGRGGPTC